MDMEGRGCEWRRCGGVRASYGQLSSGPVGVYGGIFVVGRHYRGVREGRRRFKMRLEGERAIKDDQGSNQRFIPDHAGRVSGFSHHRI